MYLAPRHLPTLGQLLPDLGNPSPREIARYLDVTERTVYAWRAAGAAPKAATLALFWESSYGLSALDAQLFNTAQVHRCLSESLGNEVKNLQSRIARLEKTGHFGCANAPFIRPIDVMLLDSQRA